MVKRSQGSQQTIEDILSKMVVSIPKTKNKVAANVIQQRLDSLNADKFFAFENAEEQIDSLATSQAQKIMALKMQEQGFSELDYSFLQWRRKSDKLPAFIVLSLDSSEFVITVEAMEDARIRSLEDVDFEISPELPEVLAEQFHDSIIYIANISVDKYHCDEISVKAKFGGIMPKDVRQKTQKVIGARIFDEIFVICEAPKWEIGKTGRTDKRDPLVVGWVEETEQMFLIAAFDMTSLEEYVGIQHQK